MNKIKKFLSSCIVKYIQHDYLKRSIEAKGTYTIEEDKIIYHIDNKSFQKIYREKPTMKIKTHLINIDDELKKACGLNKPIEYIFENINFEKAIEISSIALEGNIHFKNCTFNDQMIIYIAGKIILENNQYHNKVDVYFAGDAFFNVAGYINHLILLNDNFINSATIREHSTNKPKFGMHLKNVGTLEIKNSKITASELGKINIENAKEMIIENSTITSPQIYMNIDKIKSTNSSITATKEIKIDNKENSSIENIQAPSIIYNGIELSPSKEPQNINKEQIELQQARQNLISILKNYQEECRDFIENNILTQITVESISKVLKKKKD